MKAQAAGAQMSLLRRADGALKGLGGRPWRLWRDGGALPPEGPRGLLATHHRLEQADRVSKRLQIYIKTYISLYSHNKYIYIYII